MLSDMAIYYSSVIDRILDLFVYLFFPASDSVS